MVFEFFYKRRKWSFSFCWIFYRMLLRFCACKKFSESDKEVLFIKKDTKKGAFTEWIKSTLFVNFYATFLLASSNVVVAQALLRSPQKIISPLLGM